jgi:hypothetical protein
MAASNVPADPSSTPKTSEAASNAAAGTELVEAARGRGRCGTCRDRDELLVGRPQGGGDDPLLQSVLAFLAGTWSQIEQPVERRSLGQHAACLAVLADEAGDPQALTGGPARPVGPIDLQEALERLAFLFASVLHLHGLTSRLPTSITTGALLRLLAG